VFSPETGQFRGNNIRLGSRGDSYYEYLLKVWLQQGGAAYNESTVAYLRDMYDEAMRGVKHLLVAKSQPNNLVFVGELPHGADTALHPKMDHLVQLLMHFETTSGFNHLLKFSIFPVGFYCSAAFSMLLLLQVKVYWIFPNSCYLKLWSTT
jgi:hypothetical protein